MKAELSIEVEMRRSGYMGWILGCDEVGRGPLAGPATVSCVAYPCGLGCDFALFSQVDDSKKLSAKKREGLVEAIKSSAAAYSIIDMTPEEIDSYNILQACLFGMKRAVNDVFAQLNCSEEICVIVDGNRAIPNLGYPQRTYVKGDGRSWSIASASILAKVHRDAIMMKYDEVYPGYGFSKNVGYPTAEHRAALLKLGPTPIHRNSFHVKS